MIIGNPPYVEYSKVKKDYTIRGYETENCGNLYGFVTERSFRLLNMHASFGFIVPISFICTLRMKTLQEVLIQSSKLVWLSSFAERPSKLFSGADAQLTILLSRLGRKDQCILSTTKYTKWTSDERLHLFNCIAYQSDATKIKPHIIPKLCSDIESHILAKLSFYPGHLQNHLLKQSKYPIYYRTSTLSYKFCDFDICMVS